MHYILDGTSDDLAAKQAVKDSTATTYDNLYRQDIQVEPIIVDSVALSGMWNVTVTYGMKPPKETGDNVFSFDMTGGTTHTSHAINHISSTATPANNGKPAANWGGAINVNSETREVMGIDITIPVYNWTETIYIADSDVSSHKAAYYACTGRTNNATFRGFAAGEVLFMGCSGTKRGNQQWEITFKFAASQNVADLCATWLSAVKPSVAVPKKGWEYAWIVYDEKTDIAASRVVKLATEIHVEQVYVSADFSTMGIGT